MIYADNAATTRMDIEVFEAMKPYLLSEYGNVSQPYSFTRKAKKAIKESREIIANCIGAEPDEIFFTSGGSESDNWAIKSLLSHKDDTNIITSNIEHHAILNACKAVEKFGASVSYLDPDKEGVITNKTLGKYINNKTKLVSIMLANNEIGTIEPIAELAKTAHQHGAVFHTDAVQAVGHIPINVKQLGVDMLSASGHKFNAPKGIGFLYIKRGTKIDSYINGGDQESGKRAGTENVASIVGMATALKNNCAEMNMIAEKLRHMENLFLNTLDAADVKYLYNGAELRIPGNINISILDADGEMLLHRLDLKGICISTGSACDSASTQVSHVIESIGVPDEYAKGTIRISFGKYNHERDAIAVADAIVEILKTNQRLRY